MDRKILVVGVAAAALTVAACGRQDADVSPEKATMPDANAVATIATPPDEAAAPDFVTEMATSDLYEIAAAKLALERAANADVKAFAKEMQTAHEASSAGLQTAIASSGQTLATPTVVPSELKEKLDDLAAKTGGDFDKAYMEMQVDAHQNALNLLQRYAMDGDLPALKSFASTTGAVVQQHYDKAVALRDSLK